MSEIIKAAQALSDEDLGAVAGGVTKNYLAALDVMAGKYGNDVARINALTAAGYDAKLVQDIVNGMLLKDR